MYPRTWNTITGIAITTTPLGFSDLPTVLIWKDVESRARELSKWLMQSTAHLLNRGHLALHTYWAYLLHIIIIYVCTCKSIYITAAFQNFMTFKEIYCKLANRNFWLKKYTGNIGLAIAKPLIIAIAAMILFFLKIFVLIFVDLMLLTYVT